MPPPGTKDSFAKYLELKPDGPYAESAKSMMTTLEGTVSNTYRNPDAKGAPAPARKKK